MNSNGSTVIKDVRMKSTNPIQISNRAAPTLSVNLNSTEGEPSIKSGSLRNANQFTLPRRINSSSNVSELTPMRSFQSLGDPTLFPDEADIEDTGEDFLVNSESYAGDEVQNDDNLIDKLAQSIFSYVPSVMGQFGERHNIVSNEIPNVFELPYESNESNTNEINFENTSKNFFILSSAGKPIYSMYGSDEEITSFTAIINTVVNYFQLSNSTNIKSITSRRSKQKFVFLDKSPIIYMAYTKCGESSNDLINQLDFLHSYLLSSLTERQLNRFFSKRSNFDLRKTLEHSDFENLNEICSLMTEKLYPDLLLNSLQSQPLSKTIRTKIHDTISLQLMEDADLIPRGTLLYGLILSSNENKLTSVIRPRGHTLHTTDLQLLFCLIRRHYKTISTEQELWIPVCFPKFNSSGYLYSYIKFFSNESGDKSSLVLISAQKDAFFKLKLFSDRLWNKLILNKLDNFIFSRGFKIRDIPAPLVHHFIFRSKKHIQYVMPELEYTSMSSVNAEYDEEEDTASNSCNQFKLRYELKLKTYYRHLHDTMVKDDGNPLNGSILNFVKWERSNEEMIEKFQKEKTIVMGVAWMTPQFELYLICNNGLNDRDTVLRSARKIVSWCRKHEQRLFISDGAVF